MKIRNKKKEKVEIDGRKYVKVYYNPNDDRESDEACERCAFRLRCHKLMIESRGWADTLCKPTYDFFYVELDENDELCIKSKLKGRIDQLIVQNNMEPPLATIAGESFEAGVHWATDMVIEWFEKNTECYPLKTTEEKRIFVKHLKEWIDKK